MVVARTVIAGRNVQLSLAAESSERDSMRDANGHRETMRDQPGSTVATTAGPIRQSLHRKSRRRKISAAMASVTDA